jgi:hypothetical protein
MPGRSPQELQSYWLSLEVSSGCQSGRWPCPSGECLGNALTNPLCSLPFPKDDLRRIESGLVPIPEYAASPSLEGSPMTGSRAPRSRHRSEDLGPTSKTVGISGADTCWAGLLLGWTFSNPALLIFTCHRLLTLCRPHQQSRGRRCQRMQQRVAPTLLTEGKECHGPRRSIASSSKASPSLARATGAALRGTLWSLGRLLRWAHSDSLPLSQHESQHA